MDAIEFLEAGALKWPKKTLVYLDPPYYVKGRALYYDFYKPEDHAEVADFVTTKLLSPRWIVSYDNAPEIRALYRGFNRLVYDIGYSAGPTPAGREIMFFSDSLKVCPMVGPVKIVNGACRTRRKTESHPTEKTRN